MLPLPSPRRSPQPLRHQIQRGCCQTCQMKCLHNVRTSCCQTCQTNVRCHCQDADRSCCGISSSEAAVRRVRHSACTEYGQIAVGHVRRSSTDRLLSDASDKAPSQCTNMPLSDASDETPVQCTDSLLSDVSNEASVQSANSLLSDASDTTPIQCMDRHTSLWLLDPARQMMRKHGNLCALVARYRCSGEWGGTWGREVSQRFRPSTTSSISGIS